jgi:DHA1 family bicyclomycin/chloramphenicol resistance-like MFS transporter
VRFIIGESRELLADRRFAGYMLVCAIGTATYFAFLGSGPHIVVSIMARTSAEYGLWFIGTSAGFMLGNFITSRTSQRYGIDRMIEIGLALLIIGSVLTIAAVAAFPDGGPWTIFLPQLAISLGNGIFMPNCVAGAVSVRPRAAGTASGITGFAQMATGALVAQAMSHIIAAATSAMPLAVAMAVLSAMAALAFYVFLGRGRG